MRKLIYTIYLFVFISISCISQTKYAANLSEAIEESNNLIQELLSIYPGISISVGLGDSIVWSAGFGVANASEGEILKPYHQMRYYSLSKSITGMALIKLIESGKLNIEASVRHYLPDLPEPYQDIKIKHLIAHTSGIRAYEKGEWMKLTKYHCEASEEALNVFINHPLEFAPGTSNSYTSFGYVLLSNVIEVITGMSFIDYLKATLFEPLRINSIHLDGSSELLNEVAYYDKWNVKKSSGKLAPTIEISCKFGGGGLVGTTSDFVKLHLAMLNEQITSKELTAMYYKSLETTNGDKVNYAFGVGSNVSQSGSNYNAHSGSGRGGNGIFYVFPDSKLIVSALGSLSSKAMNEKIGEITKIFLKVASKGD